MSNNLAAEDLPELIIPLDVLFRGMIGLDTKRGYAVSRDVWRRNMPDPIEPEKRRDCLENVDQALALTVSRRSSKPREDRGQTGVERTGGAQAANLWAAVHFRLLLPALFKVLNRYGEYRDANSEPLTLSYAETAQFWSGFPFVVKHCKEYTALKSIYEGKAKNSLKAYWTENLDKWFEGMDFRELTRDDIRTILSTVPDTSTDPEDIRVKLSATSVDLKEKVEAVWRHDPAAPDAVNDSLIGRMILAYLADKGVESDVTGINPLTEIYFRPVNDADQRPTGKTGQSGTKSPLPSYYDRLLDAHMDGIPEPNTPSEAGSMIGNRSKRFELLITC